MSKNFAISSSFVLQINCLNLAMNNLKNSSSVSGDLPLINLILFLIDVMIDLRVPFIISNGTPFFHLCIHSDLLNLANFSELFKYLIYSWHKKSVLKTPHDLLEHNLCNCICHCGLLLLILRQCLIRHCPKPF